MNDILERIEQKLDSAKGKFLPNFGQGGQASKGSNGVSSFMSKKSSLDIVVEDHSDIKNS